MESDLVAVLRDTWPQQKGLAALLFQDDLFRRLRRLETVAEGKSPDDVEGFLPDEYPLFDADEDYLKVWAGVEAAVEPEGWAFVDGIEDAVCQWCEDMIPEKIAFFSAALETGELDAAWLARAEILLEAEQVPAEGGQPESAPADEATPAAEAMHAAEVPQTVIELEPERKPVGPTRRRHAGLPITPTRVRRLIRKTRKR